MRKQQSSNKKKKKIVHTAKAITIKTYNTNKCKNV